MSFKNQTGDDVSWLGRLCVCVCASRRFSPKAQPLSSHPLSLFLSSLSPGHPRHGEAEQAGMIDSMGNEAEDATGGEHLGSCVCVSVCDDSVRGGAGARRGERYLYEKDKDESRNQRALSGPPPLLVLPPRGAASRTRAHALMVSRQSPQTDAPTPSDGVPGKSGGGNTAAATPGPPDAGGGGHPSASGGGGGGGGGGDAAAATAAASTGRDEIYSYEAPHTVYALAWSVS